VLVQELKGSMGLTANGGEARGTEQRADNKEIDAQDVLRQGSAPRNTTNSCAPLATSLPGLDPSA